MKKLRVGVLGATGMVGQQFIRLLENHPWFDVSIVAASPASAGKTYKQAVSNKWKIDGEIPQSVNHLIVQAVENDMEHIVKEVDFVFSALGMEKEDIKRIEESYAAAGIPVVSNNSAHRWSQDVPMIMPEINPSHAALIDTQRKNRGWEKGLIAVKPNCSIQSYVSILTALQMFVPQKVHVVSMQAISGAGKTFSDWTEMGDNVIPYIGGEEEKSEKEPLKIWGKIEQGHLRLADTPEIAATCVRVPVSNGHMAAVSVMFEKKPSREEIIAAVRNFDNPLNDLALPSAPQMLIQYFDEQDRPQTKLDRDFENGMGISMGRLEKDRQFDWKFISLSHNTIRGAAGGAVLLAELLVKKGYI